MQNTEKDTKKAEKDTKKAEKFSTPFLGANILKVVARGMGKVHTKSY